MCRKTKDSEKDGFLKMRSKWESSHDKFKPERLKTGL